MIVMIPSREEREREKYVDERKKQILRIPIDVDRDLPSDRNKTRNFTFPCAWEWSCCA